MSGCEARSFLVLRLYDSRAALKMGTKLECEGDVEGGVVMMDEEGIIGDAKGIDK